MGLGVNFSPLVSVVIPVYNVEMYLDKCLQSVLNQTLRAIEVIAIDDASTDKSWEILQNYASKDARLIISRNEKNKGTPSYARNQGIRQAKGKYVAFIDSDDFVASTLLEKTFKGMEKYKADISYCEVNSFRDIDGVIFEQQTFKSHKNSKDGTSVFNYKNVNREFWLILNYNACFKMYRHSFLMEHQIFFDEYLDLEDLSFSIYSYILAEKIYYLPKPLYYYRRERQDSTKNRWKPNNEKQIKDGLEGLRNMYEKLVWEDRAYMAREEILYQVYIHIMRYIKDHLSSDNRAFYELSRNFLKQILQLGDIEFKYFTETEKQSLEKVVENSYGAYIFTSCYTLLQACEILEVENKELKEYTSVKGFLRYRIIRRFSPEKYKHYPKWFRLCIYVSWIFLIIFKGIFRKCFRIIFKKRGI